MLVELLSLELNLPFLFKVMRESVINSVLDFGSGNLKDEGFVLEQKIRTMLRKVLDLFGFKPHFLKLSGLI